MLSLAYALGVLATLICELRKPANSNAHVGMSRALPKTSTSSDKATRSQQLPRTARSLTRKPRLSSVISRRAAFSQILESTHRKLQLTLFQQSVLFWVCYEALSSYLAQQVFSACAMSFAHGANDVANAMGPFSAVYSVYDTGVLSSKTPVQEWILVYGTLPSDSLSYY